MQNFKVVDISAWQEKLNWQKLKANNIQGVIIKIGEYTHLDEMFISHVNNAVTYNLPYGIYYYAHASTIDESIAEANWVDKQIKTYLNGQNPPLGIWYDAEDKSILKNNINVAYMIGNFINRLNELDYNYVGLYSSYNWLTNIIDLNLLADYVPIWTAQYYHENSFKLEYPNRIFDVLPIAKARGFWDTDEPCYQKTVLRVLSTMDNALPIFIYYLREKKILSPSFFIFIAAFKSLS